MDPATEVTHFGLNKPLVFSSVNLQSLIPALFSNVKRCREGFVNLPSLLYHLYLVCILFGMPSLHP